MAEYIKREAAIEAAKHAWAKGLEPSQYMEIIPSADVAPVRHGRWIRRKSCHTQTGFIDKCSVCQNMLVHLGCKANYCPNCGAKMDGGDENGRRRRKWTMKNARAKPVPTKITAIHGIRRSAVRSAAGTAAMIATTAIRGTFEMEG